jgi:hypothetical protein
MAVAGLGRLARGPGWFVGGLGRWFAAILTRWLGRFDVSRFVCQRPTQQASHQSFTVASSHDPPGQRAPFRARITR